MLRNLYAPIDIHKDEPAPAWPSEVPDLTGPEAIRAARRLWRFSMGNTLELDVVLTSGNRYNWIRGNELRVNPDRGWRNLVHDLSHLFVSRANPGERPHSKFHARFEAKLVREVIKRGWLSGSLRDTVKAAVVQTVPGLDDRRRDKLTRIEARIVSWARKQKRAERALAKLTKQQRYYTKALGGG